MGLKQNRLIPGIYDYCDRWCERCPFKLRCSIYDPDDINPIKDGSFFNKVEEILDQTIDLVKTAILDQNTVALDNETEEAANSIKRSYPKPFNKHFLTDLSEKYFELSESWLEIHLELLLDKEEDLRNKEQLGIDVLKEREQITDAMEVIQWYLLFISSKLYRALGGLRNESAVDNSGYQSDANGSAKVALLAVEKSLSSWELLRSYFPETTDSMLDILVVLSQLQQGIHRVFPYTNDFVRPGFDEIKPLELDLMP